MTMKPMLRFFAAATAVLLAACSDLEETYERFRGSGEYAYAGKLDDIRFHVGFNRVQLDGDLRYAAGARQVVVEWNDRKETFDLTETAGDGRCRFLIGDLPEGNVVFRIYTLDAAGKRSIREQVQVYVPGERFRADQRVRTVDRFRLNADHALELEFGQSNRKVFETVYLAWRDSHGERQRTAVPASEYALTVADFEKGGEMELCWSIKPAADAIDSLTVVETYPLPAYHYEPLDRSLFRDLRLPTDAAMLNANYSVPRMWDGNPATQAHTHANNGVPNHLTVDLGAEYRLSLGRFVMRDNPWDWAPAEFQVWGLPEIAAGKSVADYEPRTDAGEVMADNYANRDVWEDAAQKQGWINLTQLNAALRSVVRSPYDVTCDCYLYGERKVRYVRIRTVKTLNKPDAAPSDGASKQYTCLAEMYLWTARED